MDNRIRHFVLKKMGKIAQIGMLLIICSAVAVGQDRMAKVEKNSVVYNGIPIIQDADESTVLNKIISIAVQDTPLLEAVEKIAEKANLKMVYNSKLLAEKNRSITVNLKQVTVEEAMWTVLEETDLRFAVSADKQLVLLKRKKANDSFQWTSSSVQETITGTVTDAQSGEILPGVNILVKGTTTGTSTDAKGNFELTVPSLQDTLVVSFIGYQTKEVPIEGRTEIDVVLQSQAIAGEELIVVGYGTQEQRDVTGSIETVGSAAIENQSITNSSQVLQGRVSGTYVNQAGGQPGADNATIRIRGIGTLSNNDPLVLVDGIESNLRDVNPNAIESISVLKDAASTAIYGSRAANGVVLVTTKSGNEGPVQVEYDNSFGWQEATVLPNMVTNSVDYMTARNQASVNEGQPKPYSDEQIEEFKNGTDPDLYPNTDWYDVMFKIAPKQEHNLRVSGGGDGITYSVSGRYMDQEGILLNTGAKNYSLNSNFQFDLFKRLETDLKISTSRWDRDEYGFDMQCGGPCIVGAISRALPIHPNILSDGRYGDTWLDTPGHNVFRHPVARTESNGDSKTNRTLIKASAKYTFPFNIAYEINFGINNYDVLESRFIPKVFLYNPKEPNTPIRLQKEVRQASRTNNNDFNTSFFQTVNWTEDISKRSNIELLLGSSVETFQNYQSDGYIEGFVGNELTEIDAGNTNKDVGGSSLEWKLMSFFGRVNYNFADKYLLNLNFRYDGSSRFAEDNRWGFFPSLSIGWRIDQEAFMKGIDFLSELKLRGAWGKVGNQSAPLFSYANSVNIQQQYSFNNTIVPGAAVTELADQSISWEETTTRDIGIDLGLWNNKLKVTTNIFDKSTTDILARINVPSQIGDLNGPVTNLYSMSNKGIETSIEYFGSVGNLDFNIGGQFSRIKNNVDFLDGDVQYENNRYGNLTTIQEGYPVDSYYLYDAIGIFQDQEEIENHAVQEMTPQPEPGDVKYRDINSDGIVNENDRIITGRSVPKYTYGFNLGLDFYGIDISAFFQGVQGINAYPEHNIALPLFNGSGITDYYYKNSWTSENRNVKYPRFGLPKRGNQANYQNSTLWLQDASYLRLKNLQVGYSLPVQQLLNVRNIRVFANAQNLFTITNYKEADPENINRENLFEYPNLRIYSLGVSLSF